MKGTEVLRFAVTIYAATTLTVINCEDLQSKQFDLIVGDLGGRVRKIRSDTSMVSTTLHRFNTCAVVALERYKESDREYTYLIAIQHYSARSESFIYKCSYDIHSSFICDSKPFYTVVETGNVVRSMLVVNDSLFIGQDEGKLYHCRH